MNKPGRLSDYEFSIIKQHTITGGEILKDIHSMQNAFIAARYHHERYDGKGYPNGLKGEEIPIFARVIAVADAYDAMTSNRVYRKKLSDDVVLQELENGRGTQFDPDIANVFIDILKRNQSAFQEANKSEERVSQVVTRQQQDGEYLAEYDGVSGLYKKEYAMELVEQIPAKAEYTFYLIGIGGFKQLNNVYGRIQGDYVLKSMGDIIQDMLEKDDFAYRVSGAMFGICMMNHTDASQIEAFAGKIIEKFQNLKQNTAVMKFASISIGISKTITEGRDFRGIYRNADCALYYAKCSEAGFWMYQEPLVDVPMTERGVGRLNKCLFSQEARDRFNVTGNKNLISKLDEAAEIVRTMNTTCYLILFELVPVRECVETDGFLVDSMNHLEISAMENVKETDKGMQFSSTQYLLIMQENSADVVKNVVGRITRQYYRMDNSKKFELEFGIEKAGV